MQQDRRGARIDSISTREVKPEMEKVKKVTTVKSTKLRMPMELA
jgi:hypothetical protein